MLSSLVCTAVDMGSAENRRSTSSCVDSPWFRTAPANLEAFGLDAACSRTSIVVAGCGAYRVVNGNWGGCSTWGQHHFSIVAECQAAPINLNYNPFECPTSHS